MYRPRLPWHLRITQLCLNFSRLLPGGQHLSKSQNIDWFAKFSSMKLKLTGISSWRLMSSATLKNKDDLKNEGNLKNEDKL